MLFQRRKGAASVDYLRNAGAVPSEVFRQGLDADAPPQKGGFCSNLKNLFTLSGHGGKLMSTFVDFATFRCLSQQTSTIFVEKFHSTSDRFVAARSELGWTQEKMARELLIDRSYLSQIENGRREPSLRLMQTLDSLIKEGAKASSNHASSAYASNHDGEDLDETREVNEAVKALGSLCQTFATAPGNTRRVIITQIILAASGLKELTK